MKITRLVIAALGTLSGLATGFGRQDGVYTINIQVFEIPPIQSMTQAGPDKNGAIVGTMTGGDVTATFPAQPVFIQTDHGPGAAEYEMKNVLYDGKYLPRNCLPGGVFWSLAGSYSISCPERDLGMDSGHKKYHEPPIAPSRPNHYIERAEYWLTILPLSADSGEATLNLKFIGKIKSAESDTGSDKILLDQNVKVVLGKMALVGFPQFATEGRKSTPRGAVYILSVLVQRRGI